MHACCCQLGQVAKEGGHQLYMLATESRHVAGLTLLKDWLHLLILCWLQLGGAWLHQGLCKSSVSGLSGSYGMQVH